MIELKNLTKDYGTTLAVNRLSLDVAAGEIYGFIVGYPFIYHLLKPVCNHVIYCEDDYYTRNADNCNQQQCLADFGNIHAYRYDCCHKQRV